jgi:hypothetical protein
MSVRQHTYEVTPPIADSRIDKLISAHRSLGFLKLKSIHVQKRIASETRLTRLSATQSVTVAS